MSAFTAVASDGTPIHGALHAGEGEGGRLVLIHSLAMDRRFWDALIERIAPEHSVVAYDCRGHGQSGKPPGPYAIETFGDDVVAVLDAIGWSDAVVAGASMGGCAALAFAQRHPWRAGGVGLIDTTAWYGPEAPAAWADRAGKAAHGGMAALIPFQVTRWFTDEFRAANPRAVELCVDMLLANDITVYGAVCHMLGAADLRAGLTDMRMPVSVIVGDEDYATPVAMAEAIQRAIPGASLHVLDRARHLTPVETPDRVGTLLTDLVGQAYSRGSRG